ncbi:MAG: FtsH protease activity modulator HflK [Magnetococcales bacterium]|nr:FtsH protease activity modulator HflK [Magnetococcales bacterium]MBF0156959.1 FtsH protease activity modulator HflK [Magnetococcales bacterium]
MTWNDNGGGRGGPWGPQPGAPQPPDMEKVFRLLQERFAGKLPGGGRQVWPAVALVLFTLWMVVGGFYVVGPDEVGVVVRFGEYIPPMQEPGPHWKYPYPIETVYKPQVTKVQRIEVGFRTRGQASVDVQAESLMLTGDENIIDIDLIVQFKIKNGADFLFNVRSPQADALSVVRNVAESAIRQVIGRNLIDDALTGGKQKIQDETRETMQKILDSYQSGIAVLTVQLQQVAAPEEVVHAFKDVASAREDRERAINEAEGYVNDIIPKARGEAARQIQEAEGYKAARATRAIGDIKRFASLLEEYSKARDVTRARLYLETMEEVLEGANKVVIQPGAGQGVLPYLPLERRPFPPPPVAPSLGEAEAVGGGR